MSQTLSVALQGGSILFREGLEALLIIAALASFLHRAALGEQVKALYAGAVLAVLASLGTAWVFATYFNGAHNDLLEGVVMLFSALLMLYVSGWLMIRQDPRVWQAEVKRAAQKALDHGTKLSLVAIAFLAVYREGAETVLFLHTLAHTSGGWSFGLFAGLGGAFVVLVVVYYIMQVLAVRLPLRVFFVATSAFLFVMAVKFVGLAMQEFQEIGYLGVTDAGLPAAVVSLGINNTIEAISVQALLVLGAVGTYMAMRRKSLAMAAAAA